MIGQPKKKKLTEGATSTTSTSGILCGGPGVVLALQADCRIEDLVGGEVEDAPDLFFGGKNK